MINNTYFEGIVTVANLLLLFFGAYLTHIVLSEKKRHKGEEVVLWNLVFFFIFLLIIAQVVHIVEIFGWFMLPGGTATVHLIIIAALLYKLLTSQKRWNVS